MKNRYLILLGSIVLFLGCEKEVGRLGTPIHPPKSISIISGNNQTGFPGEFLSDPIVLEIIPNNMEDLDYYSYYFQYEGNHVNVQMHDTIIESKIYIYANWKLTSSDEKQELLFLLYEKCNGYYKQCNKIDSILITAKLKPPWKSVFSAKNGTFHDIHFSDENNGVLIGELTFHSGYFSTSDGGETWKVVANNRTDLYQLSFADSDTGIVILANNWAHYTNDGGKSFYQGEWSPPIPGHRSSTDYFMLNSKEIFTVGTKGRIAKSVDGGKTWSSYEGFSFQNVLFDIDCVDKNTCFACGEIGKVVKTTDGGVTWNEQEILINNYLKKIYFLDKNHGFAAGQFGALVRTINGGKDWEIINTGLKYTIIEIYFYNSDIGYIVSSAGEIGKTIDGGLTWELINKDNYEVNYLNRAIFKDNTILGLQGGSIYKFNLSNE